MTSQSQSPPGPPLSGGETFTFSAEGAIVSPPDKGGPGGDLRLEQGYTQQLDQPTKKEILKLLVVAATPFEAEQIIEAIGCQYVSGQPVYNGQFLGIKTAVLITGVGMTNTALSLGRFMTEIQPTILVDLGIAGSFNPEITIGEVVEITRDSFSELGAESPDGFLDLEQMGFPAFKIGGKAYYNTIENPRPSNLFVRKTSAITVNTVHGKSDMIADCQKLWGADLETMEGAAFFQAALIFGKPFCAFRAVSNYVEPRNLSNWKIKEACASVQSFLLAHFGQIVEYYRL